MSIKCILFDADGVVIKAEMFSIEYEKEYNVSSAKMLPFFKSEFQKCLVGKADLIEVIEPWLPKWKWISSVDDFLKFWFKAEHKIDNKMVDIIKLLRKTGIKCYLATNQEKYRTEYIKNQMRFKEFFDGVFSSADIGYKKPEIEFYEIILEEIKRKNNINPNEIMFFDDSKDNVKTAKQLGIDACFYESFDEFEKIADSLLV